MRRITPLQLDRVTRTVGHGDAAERLARTRLADLSAVEHPGVCVPLDVMREGDAVVACMPRVDGRVLASLPPVEEVAAWVWLVHGLAEALAALHAPGLAHGDVAPGNVMVGAVPVLIDLVGAAVEGERGTPGFAAPERAAGGAPSPAADVYSLGAVALAAAGLGFRAQAEAWMAPLLDPDPEKRPSAVAVARGIVACASPRRWVPPSPGEDDAPAIAPDAATIRDPRAWHWRLRRRPLRLVGAVAGIALVAGGGAWAAPHGWGVLADPSPTEAVVETSADAAAPHATVSALGAVAPPADAAVALTRARVSALAQGAGDALVELTVPGSAAWATAAREARQLEQVELRGLRLLDARATVVRQDGGRAEVDVAYALSAYERAEGKRGNVAVPAERGRARLTLSWSGERWRVEAVSAPP